jgi:hypothetical protein
MSEVQRFWSHEASNIRCVREADFDRVTAERDAALADLASASSDKEAYAQNAIDLRKRVDALQQRLTAADERVDVLEGLLRDVSESVTGRQGTFARIPADWFDRRDAALKPAEVSDEPCEFCKGWGFRANSETGADEGCGACNGTGSTPSEDQP